MIQLHRIMNENLLIKYIEQDNEGPGFDLGLLGESFTGFNDVFKELFEISQIQGDLVLRTTKISEGSIDVVNLVQVVISHSPFKDPRDLLDFLQIVDATLYQQASNFFNAIGNGHKTVNDFFREYEFSGSVVSGSVGGIISGLVVLYFPKMIAWSGLQKSQLTTENEGGEKISERSAKKLQNMVASGKYKKALKPLSENGVSSVKIVALKSGQAQVVIDEAQLEKYLPEEEKILPELQNGNIINLTGQILALQSTRGETLKFEASGIEPKYKLLTAHPGEDKKTEDYKDFYKKLVNIKAEVYRKSLYQRPELIIQAIETSQTELFTEE